LLDEWIGTNHLSINPSAWLLLRIDQDSVVDEDDEIVFAIAGHVRDSSFAWFGQITPAAAEGAFLEDLPAIRRH